MTRHFLNLRTPGGVGAGAGNEGGARGRCGGLHRHGRLGARIEDPRPRCALKWLKKLTRGLLGVLGEDNEVGEVLLEALHVALKARSRAVLAAVVHGDADGGRKRLGDAGGLELLEGETPADALLHVVTHRLPQDNGPEGTRHGAGEHARGLSSTSCNHEEEGARYCVGVQRGGGH